MTGVITLLDQPRTLDALGRATDAIIFFYYTGTTNLAPIYNDAELTDPAANPVELAAGEIFPDIYLDPALAYRRRILYGDGSIHDVDPLPFGAGDISGSLGWVTPEMFGAAGDYDPVTQTGTDDSVAFQEAVNAIPDGGKIYLTKKYLVGGVEIPQENVIVEGVAESAAIAVKAGELGVWAKEDWIHFRNLSIISQGNRNDGLNTRGILYTKGGTGQSIGHVFNYGLIFGIVDPTSATAEGCFSGYALELRNGLDIRMTSVLIYKAGDVGFKIGRNGTGGADFTTTTFLDNFYVIGCVNYGIDSTYVYRSEFNIIAEFNGVGIRNIIGDLSLHRSYFESNTTLGAELIDTLGQDVMNYSNDPVTDAVTRSRNVIANADWYTVRQASGDFHSKRLGVQTAWGRDTEYLTGVGTTDNIGLKYGQAIIPLMPGTDLLDQKAWASVTTSEYVGFDIARGMHEISTALTGARGMQQSISLDSTKTYVAYFYAENVTGAALTSFQVDGVAISNGVPFTVASTGSKVVRCFGSQSIASENYVLFHLFEVTEDISQIAKGISRLLAQNTKRSSLYGSAPPATGRYAAGEVLLVSDPTTKGVFDYGCIIGGTPGTWRPIRQAVFRGTTAQRPTLLASDVGVMYFDNTLDADGKPIWWNGTAWVDATGAVV